MTTRIFFGSPGDDLSEMTELTGVVSDGFKLIGEAAEETGRVLEAFSKCSTCGQVGPCEWHQPRAYRLIENGGAK